MTVSTNPTHWTISDTAEQLGGGTISSAELTQAYLDAIQAENGRLNAYITVDAEGALAAAREADRKRVGGEQGPLLGVPLAIKDNICTRGQRTTCGSRILNNYLPPYDAQVIELLRAAGAVILGKTNMDEFAMGSSTETSHYGATRNPANPEHIPGGSSGGSAAAVAANLCAGALGSDTGGSIRQPAACCGCVGLKPTYGRVSRYGLVAFGSSLDQIGPLTKSVEDAARLLEFTAGHDPRDSTSADRQVPSYTVNLHAAPGDLRGLRIGLPREYFIEGLDPEVDRLVRKAVTTLEAAGAETVEVSLPHTKYAVATYYVCATAEASSNLARYDGIHYGFTSENAKGFLEVYTKTRSEGFGAEVKRRIMLGTYALSAGFYDAYYLRALKVRTLIKKDFEQAFEGVDTILTPVTPTPAFKLGERVDDPLQMYLSDIFTISANLAGIPGLTIPCGRSKTGLPVSFQLMGPAFGEEMLFQVGRAYETSTASDT